MDEYILIPGLTGLFVMWVGLVRSETHHAIEIRFANQSLYNYLKQRALLGQDLLLFARCLRNG